MKWLFYALIFEMTCSLAATGQTLCRLRADTNTVSFQTRNGDNVAVSVRHLLYKDENGDTLPTADSYVFEVVNGHYPRIVDCIYGDHLSFELSSFGRTNGQKLLVFYHAGGHTFGVKTYTIDVVEIIPLKTQPLGSNMDSIQFKGEDIIVENQELNTDYSTSFYTDTYQVVSNECKLLSEQKEIVPPETNTATN